MCIMLMQRESKCIKLNEPLHSINFALFIYVDNSNWLESFNKFEF